MKFIRSLIDIPVFILVIVLAVMNDESTRFVFKSFDIKITVTVSVLILVLFFLGYFIGRFDGYVANAPLRLQLREHKKVNKALNREHEKLNKEHEKLSNNFSHLKEDFQHLKVAKPEQTKPFKERFSNFFKFKKD